VGLARKCALPGIGGSDGHTLREIGGAYTALKKSVTSEEELVAELRLGKHRVHLREQPQD
jgi:hypothetical protein